MLTGNADDHPLMNRFHAPDDEKRMVVILDPSEYSEWLSCSVTEANGSLSSGAARDGHDAPPDVEQFACFHGFNCFVIK